MPLETVVHVNANTITAVMPVLVGTNNGKDLAVSLTIGGQTSTSTFTYTAPTLTRVDRLSPVRSDGSTTITLHGTDFANVNIDQITVATRSSGSADVPCSNVQRVDYETVTCDLSSADCTDRNVFVSVAGQESTATTVKLCPFVSRLRSTGASDCGNDNGCTRHACGNDGLREDNTPR